ncbi:thiosulfate dehydrogenase [Pontibacter aydingkolensis]|uniref:C-type cytochrome n=1 Tax=Pontibacter aydingkolensis TaxID=1911536 RepID=A0ABS7CW08_9BACT|nr:c-type cytochrome [Pontibacter aydingkolensis]MBW7468009.1 c-type cytochrome [Pontibacter aydingkolensis]
MKQNKDQEFGGVLVKISRIVSLITFAVVLLLGLVILLLVSPTSVKLPEFAQSNTSDTIVDAIAANTTEAPADDMWHAADIDELPATPEGDQIRYGRELIAHTAQYLGPEGSVLQISNGMNCQNCHLDAGTKPFGNNYSRVASTYPKFRARSGTEEDVVKRVNDCFERSLNGQPLEADMKEMQAIVAYINWVGKDVKKDEKPKGAGLIDIELLDRAASPEKGKLIYAQKCQVCHGEEGEGQMMADGKEYQYPPLWGKHSYNNGAGLYRLSNFAKYVKANMPLGATYDRPQLTDEESWDLAAYVNSIPRPVKTSDNTKGKDWPDISKKPFDHPFGPYADSFSEEQHKFGPYQEIIAAKEKKK